MSWVSDLADQILERTQHKNNIVLQCGYGPSGPPHLGTYAEVARTDMIRQEIQRRTDKHVEIIVFSDDQDALRKVPINVPNRTMLEKYVGVSLNHVPDPWGVHGSYAEHNNQELMRFLNMYGFEYTFVRSSDLYQNRVRADWCLGFNKIVHKLLMNVDSVKEIVTQNYRSERKSTYCPVIPFTHNYEHVFSIDEFGYLPNSDYGSFDYRSNGVVDFCYTQNPYGGNNFKFQWKVDWPMRWLALGVDFEMHGKDLMDSVRVGKNICQHLGYEPPLTFQYELFLDHKGRKISKSEGNGLEFDQWIRYAPVDSLRWFLSQNPKKSRKIYLEMVPQTVDSYLRELSVSEEKYVNSGAYMIHGPDRPEPTPISYNMLLNLVNIANTRDVDTLWGYIQNYVPDASPDNYPLLSQMVTGAINYYVDFVEPSKNFQTPSVYDREAMLVLASEIELFYRNTDLEGEELANALMNNVIYEVGKRYYGEDKTSLRENFFGMLYRVLMGQSSGPRFGQFAVVYGIENTVNLLRSA